MGSPYLGGWHRGHVHYVMVQLHLGKGKGVLAGGGGICHTCCVQSLRSEGISSPEFTGAPQASFLPAHPTNRSENILRCFAFLTLGDIFSSAWDASAPFVRLGNAYSYY